jgi:hypothetical protein
MNFYRHSRKLAAFALATLAALSSPLYAPHASAQVSVLTNKNDNARDGLNSSETLLSSANVTSTQFGKLFAANVDGYVSAQPLYMYGLTINGGTHNVVFVATEHDSVYAIDADTGTQLWQTSLLYPSGATTEPMSVQGCGGVTGLNEVGILGTPVIDATTNTLYVDAKTALGSNYYHYLHALDVTTGLEKLGGPVSITGTLGNLTLSAKNQLQRPALLELNGTIYIGFGSNGCDIDGRGWLFAYSASTLQQLAVMVTQPDQSYGSSIWQSGTGPAADSNGNIYLSTANGDFAYPNFPDFGDSILRLTFGSGGFTVADYFTPFDQASLASADMDMGSGGPTLLPLQTTGPYPDLLATANKRGDIYLINSDNMGGYNPTDNTQIVQYLPGALAKYYHASPLYWNNGSTQLIYFLSHQDYLKAFSLTNGQLSTTPAAQTTSKLTTLGLPSISSNGNTNGIVWLVRSISGVPLLSAYDANVLFLMYDSGMAAGGRDSLGTVTHFATPTVANGKVYAGTFTQLVAYGLFPALMPTAGNGQTGAAGTTLPTAITVTATNPYTHAPIPGVNVTFSDGGKGGTFGSPTGTTDVNGLASTTYKLPNTPQTITITCNSPGYATATFTESDVAGAVASISTISGAKQSGTVGTTLPAPIVVKAKDAVGNAISGALILFADGGVGGVFSSPNPVATGSTGQASVTYTLPLAAKSITVTASNGSVTDRITEMATAGPPSRVNLIQGNNQMAHIHNKLPKALIVSVTDQYGNGLPGLTVNFTDNGAGGTFSNSSPITGATGQVSVTYTTPTVTGIVTIDATYGSLAPAVFTETVQ